jgi:hypothetical protein
MVTATSKTMAATISIYPKIVTTLIAAIVTASRTRLKVDNSTHLFTTLLLVFVVWLVALREVFTIECYLIPVVWIDKH